MHQSDILNAELSRVRERLGKDDLYILETGTIRGDTDNYHQGDGWSTLTFARHAAQFGGHVTSIDLKTDVSDRVLRQHGVRDQVTLVESHSIDALARLVSLDTVKFDVILLDSDNDARLILHEYLVAQYLLAPLGTVLVDDVDLNSTGVVKGHDLVPWLGVEPRIERREGNGYSTGVLVIEP